MRINYNYTVDGLDQYNGYFIGKDGNLTSDRKIRYVEKKVDGQTWSNWVPDTDAITVISLNNSHKKDIENFNFAALENSIYTLSGIIKVPDGFVPSDNSQDYSMIRIEARDANSGEWLGNGRLSSDTNGTDGYYKYSISMDSASKGKNISIKIIKELYTDNTWDSESFYLNFGADHQIGGTGDNADRFVAEDGVEYVSVQVDGQDWDNWIPKAEQTGYLTLDDTTKITLDVDYQALYDAFDNHRLAISGTVILSDAMELGISTDGWYNSVRIEAIDKNTGDWVTSVDVDYKSGLNTEFDYELDFVQKGDYIIRAVIDNNGQHQEFYLNFGTDHTNSADDRLVDGQKVSWSEASEQSQWGYKQWMPNPTQTGYISLEGKVEDYSIDIAKFEDQVTKITGEVIVGSDFAIGDKYDDNYNWIGRNSIRVEAISKTTGEYIASADVGDDYKFKLIIGDMSEVGHDFIIKITQEETTNNSWDSQEMYYNFGSNNLYDPTNDSNETLVNGKKISWTEAKEKADGRNWKMWMPNPNQTGWINISDNTNPEVLFDISTFGQNDIKLSGTVTFGSDFNISDDSYQARVSAIDATTGNWIGDTAVDQNGSFELNVGEDTGKYILQVNYSYYDYTNWQNSWWKDKYIDFGNDHAVAGSGDNNDSILSDNQVNWKSIRVPGQDWDAWVPDVNYLEVNSNISGISIDTTATSGGTIEGTIDGLSGIENPYILIVSPTNNINSYNNANLNNGVVTFKVEELAVASYTVEIGFQKDGKYYDYFIDGNATDGYVLKNSNEVSWGANGPEGVTYYDVVNNGDINITTTYVAEVSNSIVATLGGVEDGKNVSANLYIPNKPFSQWEDNISSGTNVGFTFDDVESGSEYILSFDYDGASYVCNNADCNETVKNPEWVAKNSSDDTVCGGAAGWDCNWSNSYNWTWTPDVTPLSIDGNETFSATIPAQKTISGSIDLDSEFIQYFLKKETPSILKLKGFCLVC